MLISSSGDEALVKVKSFIHHPVRGKARRNGFTRRLAQLPCFRGIRKQACYRGCQSA